MKFALTALAVLITAVTTSQTAQAKSVERYYCTQYGPFFIRFDPDKAAGVFAILPNNDLGSIVGSLNDRTLEGEWIEVDSRGEIKLTFSEDWSRFDAEYTVSDDPDNWLGGWIGVLKPNDEAAVFEHDGVTFNCR